MVLALLGRREADDRSDTFCGSARLLEARGHGQEDLASYGSLEPSDEPIQLVRIRGGRRDALATAFEGSNVRCYSICVPLLTVCQLLSCTPIMVSGLEVL